ncbi:MAG: VOC family protein [Chloroflexota bacterium]
MSFSLAQASRIGEVSLTVKDISRSLAYYQKLGLHLHRQESNAAWLGDGVSDLLVLRENPEAQFATRTTGLYHFAILVPTRIDLAKALKNMIDAQIEVGGFSDHIISEAIYLSDPDGNGIEVYADRARDLWEYRTNGEMRIDTVPLDLQNLLGELEADEVKWQGFPKGTTVGHVHLHVSDLEEAGRFYSEVLGFDFIAKYGRSAQFLSVGGYHHHIGMNTWAGVGIPKPPQGAIGLHYYSLVLPDEVAKAALLSHLDNIQVSYDKEDGEVFIQDPAGNWILLATERIKHFA